jgi:hypothetical protein
LRGRFLDRERFESAISLGRWSDLPPALIEPPTDYDAPSDNSNFDLHWIANRLRLGDIARPRATTNTAFFDKPAAGCEADRASAANHDATGPRDE